MSTAVYEGYTLVSPSVYISFETAYAMNDCNSTIGQAHTGSIIGLDPADLSSAVGNQHYLSYSPASGTVSAVYSMAAAPFNLNNLDWPYNPWAYLNQPSCNTRGGLNYDFDCHVILEDGYFPVLVVPDEIRNMDPAWASCALDWEGLYDPPLALTPATAPASVTLPRPRTSTDAAPTTPASAAATPTTPAAETSPPASAQASTPTTPDATADEPAPTAEADQTDGNESNPTSADPDDASDQTQANSSPVATADPTTTGIGDFIASVIGLVPSAAAVESAEEGSEGGNAQPTPVDSQDPSDDDDPGTGTESHDPAPAKTTLGENAGTPGHSDSAGTVPSNGSPAVSTQNNEGSGAPIATFVGDGSTFTATQIASDAAVVDGNTLSVGGSATVVAGQTISFGSDGIVAASGGSTTAIQFVDPAASAASSASAPIATFVADGTTYTAVQADGSSGSTAVLNDGATLSVGGAATTLAGGQTVSLGADGILVNNGDSTSTAAFVAPASAESQEATFVAGGTTYTAFQTGGAGTAVLGGATLSQGGPAATLANGETVSLGPAGLVVVDGEATSTAGFQNPQATSGAAQQATFAIDGTTYTAVAAGSSDTVVIDGQTLSIGGSAITVDGQTISLGSSGIVIAADGTTTTAQLTDSATPTNWISQAIITAGSSTLTAYGIAGESGKIVLDGTTLTQGGSPITINGEVFSLGKDGLVDSEDGKKTTLSGVGISTPSISATKNSRSTSSESDTSRLVTSPASRASSSSVRETGSSTTSAGFALQPRNRLMGLALLSVMVMFM
ncbi:hypothetical protein PRZ48_007863 [Zasmidium cellare]|uniref:Uncharacterized protein n=1 Tax=Zasmidium cellare TaxID=395010 RepID=A0ABR0EKG7_ZASCE|nr:hypothetical protein PRZ48_007863 [Zasmidium cellare]